MGNLSPLNIRRFDNSLQRQKKNLIFSPVTIPPISKRRKKKNPKQLSDWLSNIVDERENSSRGREMKERAVQEGEK